MSDKERARALTREALERADTRGWGGSLGPSARQRALLRAGAAAGALAFCAVAALGCWGASELLGELGRRGRWPEALACVLAVLMAAGLAAVSVGQAAHCLALGAGRGWAMRSARESARVVAWSACALTVLGPLWLAEAALDKASQSRRLGRRGWRFCQRLSRWRHRLEEAMENGPLRGMLRAADRSMTRWERVIQARAPALGPLAAWASAGDWVGVDELDRAVRAWSRAPFDPSWPLGEGDSLLEIFAQAEREGERLGEEGAPLDWRRLEALVEREGLAASAGRGALCGEAKARRL